MEGTHIGGLFISVKAFQIQAAIVQTCMQLPGANEERRVATNNPLSDDANRCHFMEPGELLISPSSLPLPQAEGQPASVTYDGHDPIPSA